MKKSFIPLICIILICSLLLGCSGQKEHASGPAKSPGTEEQHKDKPADEKKSGSSKVFKANELLSAEEASKIVGAAVTINEGTLSVDSETGTSKTYYDFEYNESTDLSALFLLKQNGAIPKDKLKAGNTAEDAYNQELKFAGGNAETKSGLGDKAFIHKGQVQVNVLYGDYYFLVGFNGNIDDKGKEINIEVAKKIIENINKKK